MAASIPTRNEAMIDGSIHNLTKDVLRMTEDKDIVDRYYDVQLAADILKKEMDERLGIINVSFDEM